LISLMLGKKVILLPVGYHKTKSFYETWLADHPNVAFVSQPEELAAAVDRLRSQHIDYSALFCRYADPAFQRFVMQCQL
jgi:exopolysaccharide biosynthesis predicted pyruvyltransferase EpsI